MLASGFWIGLGVGLFLGAIVGFFTAALMAAAAASDRTAEEIYRRLPKPPQNGNGKE